MCPNKIRPPSLALFFALISTSKLIIAQDSDTPEHVFENSRFTFYDVDLNNLTCKNFAVPADQRIVSLNTQQWDNGAHCGEKVQIEASELITEGTILDECPGCGFSNLDLSPEFFSVYGDLAEGLLTGFWHFEATSTTSGLSSSNSGPTTTSSSSSSSQGPSETSTPLSLSPTSEAPLDTTKPHKVQVVVGASV
ncbi:hypothetical protein K435DRAFT_391803, partial [Dendrothele bispora CBS 962.96]